MTRKNNISLLRLLCTLIVLIYHIFFIFAPSNFNFYYLYLSFGVQVLCFASGLLYSQKEITNLKEFYKKSLLKLIIPCLIFVILILSLDAIILLFQNNLTFNSFINSTLSYRVSKNALLVQFGNLWFVPIYFVCYLLLPLFQKLTKKLGSLSVFIFTVIVLIEMLLCTPPVVYPFIFGYLIGKAQFNKIVNHNPKKLLTIIGSIVLIAVCLFAYKLSVYPASNKFLVYTGNFLSKYFQGTISVFIATLFLTLFQFVNKFNFLNKIFAYTDKICLNIYVANQAFMVGILSVWGLTSSHIFDALIIILETLICAIIISHISCYIIQKINNSQKKC